MWCGRCRGGMLSPERCRARYCTRRSERSTEDEDIDKSVTDTLDVLAIVDVDEEV